MNALLREIGFFFANQDWRRDLVDVAVVAFLVYRVLLLIRGTRAVQHTAGLSFLCVVGLLANLLGLTRTKAIFNNLAPALLVAVVVLFQPELRRALDRVGRVGLLGRPLAHYSLQMMGRLVDEVVDGAEGLSGSRTGALIVFERDVGLENYALTGVRINGEVTAELLQTIFFPNSPLHDGACILRGNQVVAAGCLLPMGDEVLPQGRRMGTRHRAGLGLSLESDAVVVIVSEETGRISVARDGKLEQGLDGEMLRTVLRGALLPRPRPRLPRRRPWVARTASTGPTAAHPVASVGETADVAGHEAPPPGPQSEEEVAAPAAAEPVETPTGG